ncbi:MAG: glutathione S-transferase [Pseudomonadota bacterium]|nr:glutathione S-transferase [Pseudomonadota bacterium]
MENHPVLYSYRRCPYAMRARIGIYLSGIPVEQREIVFWDKPEPMLQASPKGTVPVLILSDGQVIDESRDILIWAFNQAEQACSDLIPQDSELMLQMNQWIDRNDDEFKIWLDQYKYSDRFPENSQTYYRQQGEVFLSAIEQALQAHPYLLGEHLTVADLAIFPFIRQFVNVDKPWFEQADYPNLKSWLACHLQSDYFLNVMKNRPVWQAGHVPLWVHEVALKTKNEFTDKALKRIECID